MVLFQSLFINRAVASLHWELMASATYLFALFIPKHFTFVTTAQPVHKMDAGPDFTVIVIACDDAVQLAVFIGLDAFQLAVRIEKFASAVQDAIFVLFFEPALLIAVAFSAFADDKSAKGLFTTFLIDDPVFDSDLLDRDFAGAGKNKKKKKTTVKNPGTADFHPYLPCAIYQMDSTLPTKQKNF
jgi:hypothetical protein